MGRYAMNRVDTRSQEMVRDRIMILDMGEADDGLNA